MTTAQLSDWLVYARLEPFGDMAQDRRDSEMASMFANANITGGRAIRPSDFALHEPQISHEDEMRHRAEEFDAQMMGLVQRQ